MSENNHRNSATAQASNSNALLYDNLRAMFKRFRFNVNTHVGLGDIRLSIGAQEEILKAVAEATGAGYTGM